VDINCYALEVITKARLAELRADAARYTLLASLRTPQTSVWTALGSALLRAGRRSSRRRVVNPRPA
jgi:hypothetical protein